MSISTDPWVWMSALITIGIYSVLFKDNPAYRILESIFIGMAAGYLVVVNWFSFLRPTIVTDVLEKHNYLLVIPIILGALVYTRYSRNYAWLSRYSMSFMMGIGAGYVLTKDFKPLFLAQAKATMLPLWVDGKLSTSINNTLIVLGVACSLMYFFFTVKRTGILGFGSRLGRLILMVAFGAAFGNTVMGRVSVTLGRFQYMLTDWLGIVK